MSKDRLEAFSDGAIADLGARDCLPAACCYRLSGSVVAAAPS